MGFTTLLAITLALCAVLTQAQFQDVSKTCQENPSKCVGVGNEDCVAAANCTSIVYIEEETNSIILSGLTKPASYVALGFSDDPKMGGELIVVCATKSDNTPVLCKGYDDGFNSILSTEKEGITENELLNGNLYCNFTMEEASAGNYTAKLSGGQMYYLLLAEGDFKEDENPPALSGRGGNTAVSDNSFMFGELAATGLQDTLALCQQPGTTCVGVGEDDCVAKQTCKSVACLDISTNSVILAGAPTVDTYVAIGFSEDQAMGDELVIGCMLTSNGAEIHKGYDAKDPGKGTTLLNELDGITQNDVAENDLYCSFTLSPETSAGDYKAVLSGGKVYYLLLAQGAYDESTGIMSSHHKDNAMSDAVRFGIPDPTGLKDLIKLCKDDIANCLPIPSNDNCVEANNCTSVAYVDKKSNSILMAAENNADWYVAIGFSPDKLMKDELVVACILQEDNKVIVRKGYDYPNPHDGTLLLEDLDGIIVDQKSLVDGNLKCNFSIPVSATAANYTAKMTDSESYYLLLAQGPVNATTGQLRVHNGAAVSENKYTFNSLNSSATTTGLAVTALLALVFARLL